MIATTSREPAAAWAETPTPRRSWLEEAGLGRPTGESDLRHEQHPVGAVGVIRVQGEVAVVGGRLGAADDGATAQQRSHLGGSVDAGGEDALQRVRRRG